MARQLKTGNVLYEHNFFSYLNCPRYRQCFRVMTTILPLQLQSRSEPYQLVTRRGSILSPLAQLCIEEFTRESGKATAPL